MNRGVRGGGVEAIRESPAEGPPFALSLSKPVLRALEGGLSCGAE